MGASWIREGGGYRLLPHFGLPRRRFRRPVRCGRGRLRLEQCALLGVERERVELELRQIRREPREQRQPCVRFPRSLRAGIRESGPEDARFVMLSASEESVARAGASGERHQVSSLRPGMAPARRPKGRNICPKCHSEAFSRRICIAKIDSSRSFRMTKWGQEDRGTGRQRNAKTHRDVSKNRNQKR